MRTFVIHSCLGKGRFAEVFSATDTMTTTPPRCALKIAYAEHAHQNLIHEAGILYCLNREHCKGIPALLWFGRTPDPINPLCLALAASMSLYSYTAKEHPPVTEKDICGFAVQLVDIVQHIHDCGIVHRDLKPDNIMMDSQSRLWKLVDFGLAGPYEVESQEPYLQECTGTVRFVSIHVHNGYVPTRRDDMISLIYIVWWMISAQQLPWDDLPCHSSRLSDPLLKRIQRAKEHQTCPSEWVQGWMRIMQEVGITDRPPYSSLRLTML
jgi:serine/threonine protein kinase